MAAMLVAGLAGCIGTTQGLEGASHTSDAAGCDVPASIPGPEQVCTLVLDPTEGIDREVSLAADPGNAQRIAAAWIESHAQQWTIWIATTLDGGANWTFTNARDVPTVGDGQLFDPTIAYGPHGTLYVLFGEMAFPHRGLLHMAASADGGQTWNGGLVSPELGPAVNEDAMMLSVSPDTGDLHVVAVARLALFEFGLDVGLRAGVWYWRSDDGGQSWSAPFNLDLPDPAWPNHGLAYWPRIAAGPEGLVVVSLKGSDGLYVRVSHDAGQSWQAPARTFDGPEYRRVIGNPASIAPNGRIDLTYAAGGDLWLVRSHDRGASWSDPYLLATAPNETTHDWQVAAATEDDVYTLQTHGGIDEKPWGAYLIEHDAEDDTRSLDLTGTHNVTRPRGPSAGDEYGGLAVGADGTLWAAWSDPRSGEAQVRLARVVLPFPT